ncbi:MAG TPA: FAD-dependent oxidoreductase [Caulobacteraceae bacterium]|nr:FAD-dependent oxidoreductase [Caulobacteraceae bacterium]
MTRHQVLIVGAGPTGLALALWLAKLGVKVRIIDKTEGPGTTSRALAVQARTLELYRQLGIADAVVALGHKVPAVNLWVRGERAARVAFAAIGEDLTPFPFLKILPQDEHEKLLIEYLAGFGVAVERRTELVGFTDGAGGVTARLRGPDGAEETCEADYIAGCDGARSVVRGEIGAGFAGGTYRQVFYVADVEAAGPSVDGELHVDLDEADFLAVFPLAGEGRARLIGTVRDERAEHPEDLKFEDVSAQAIAHMKVEVRMVNWFSTYHVHHRVTDHFRKGRAFLLGDAAHIHSPAGGQGMNTGIGDAINLAWKLAWVLSGRATDALLDSYEAERIGFARRLVASTDRAFGFATADGPVAEFVRTRLAPLVIPSVMLIEPLREFMFRTISQITLNYRGSPLSVGRTGDVQAGDRLPWTPASTPQEAAALAEMGWQVQVYGQAPDALAAWSRAQGVPLHVFAFRDDHRRVGIARDAAYLLRPDTYLALADPRADPATLERYFADRGIKPGS